MHISKKLNEIYIDWTTWVSKVHVFVLGTRYKNKQYTYLLRYIDFWIIAKIYRDINFLKTITHSYIFIILTAYIWNYDIGNNS